MPENRIGTRQVSSESVRVGPGVAAAAKAAVNFEQPQRPFQVDQPEPRTARSRRPAAAPPSGGQDPSWQRAPNLNAASPTRSHRCQGSMPALPTRSQGRRPGLRVRVLANHFHFAP